MRFALVAASLAAASASAGAPDFSQWRAHDGAAMAAMADGSARARFADTLHTTGWGKLDVQMRPEAAGADAAAFGAGFLEGVLTAQRCYEGFVNQFAEFFATGEPAPAVLQFIEDNWAWTSSQVQANPGSDYWRAVGLVQRQFDGLVAGHQHACGGPLTCLTRMDLMMMNLDGDLETITQKLQPADDDSVYDADRILRCSAMVKLLPDGSDIVLGHATWDDYEMMNRIYKVYDYGPNAVSFSSSPGFLASIDDFYVTAKGLLVTETTNGVYNEAPLALVTPDAGVMSWIRSSVANALAEDGAQWAELFAGETNSGTYNNQWMCLDSNKFEPGQTPADGAFTVLEQAPGLVVWDDQTAFLREHLTWPSYNIPFYEEIYNYTGFPEMEAQFGAEWSYDECPRALLFAQHEGEVTDLGSFKDIMRLNDWRTDPAAQGNPGNAIASRHDLTPVPDRRLGGAIDAKVTSAMRIKSGRLTVEAVNGPTTERNPPFQWTPHLAGGTSHLGHPLRFDFGWEEMEPYF